MFGWLEENRVFNRKGGRFGWESEEVDFIYRWNGRMVIVRGSWLERWERIFY